MPSTIPSHDLAAHRGPGFVSRVAGVAVLVAALSTPLSLEGQDPVSGRWFATVEDGTGSTRTVFVLEARGEAVRGRRVFGDSEALEVSGRREGQSVRLEFEVPEGRSAVTVVIEAEAFQGRMTGTWTAVLPSGQRVVRPWHAERTRAGASR